MRRTTFWVISSKGYQIEKATAVFVDPFSCDAEHCKEFLLKPGSNEYSRVLDYSIFKSLLVPYSENFTTRPSSRVVAIFTFLVRIIKISKKLKMDTSVMTSCITPNNVYLHSSWNSWTKCWIWILLVIIFQTELLNRYQAMNIQLLSLFLGQSINRLSQEKGK